MSDRSFLTGLLGRDLGQSLSPALHNYAFRDTGVDGLYQPIDFSERNLQDSDLPDVLAWIKNFGFSGVNVTHPFKTAVLPLMDNLSDDARALGAVNTVVIREGKTTGHNTDWLGFSAQLDTLGIIFADLSGPVLVLGAGGAGRAVIHALRRKGVHQILLSDPDAEMAARTANLFPDTEIGLVADLQAAAECSPLLVNASTVGMHGKGGLPLPANLIQSGQIVAEVIYFPVETPLVLEARSRGCVVATGDIMCLHQATASFELMTGEKPSPEKMSTKFRELVERSMNSGI